METVRLDRFSVAGETLFARDRIVVVSAPPSRGLLIVWLVVFGNDRSMPSHFVGNLIAGFRKPTDAVSYIYGSGLDWYLTNIASTHIYQRDWNALIILDACRVDLLQEIAPEYPYFDTIDSIYSVAAQSETWMRRSFSETYSDKMEETVLVTGNPYSGAVLRSDDFLELDEVWRYAWDDSMGTIPPRPVTDRAISLSRNLSPNRIIVHYMQPHFPCIPGPTNGTGVSKENFGRKPMSIWEDLEEGTVRREELWSAYQRNLRHVLEDVSLLVENLDAETAVVTSDHGNAFGENDEYGHNKGSVLEEVRRVPWVNISATDNNTYDPDDYDREPKSTAVDERLADLGYR